MSGSSSDIKLIVAMVLAAVIGFLTLAVVLIFPGAEWLGANVHPMAAIASRIAGGAMLTSAVYLVLRSRR
jgi:hypothetical protein